MYWPLVTQAAARLSAPFMAFILACLVLQEFANLRTIFYLMLTVTGAAMIVFNSEASDEDSARIS